MASRFSIEAVVSMIDRVSNPMGKAAKSVSIFSQSAMKSTSMANRAFSGLRNTIGSFVGIGSVVLLGKQFADFDDAIYGATARFKAAEKPGTNMAVVMQNLRDASRKTGAETQFTAKLMAEGLNKFALAGFTSQEAINSLRTQVDLATVTGEDFIRVADISSDLLGAFGGAALESSEKIAMLKQMNALLAVGTLSANVTMEDLFETLKSAAPIGTQAGAAMDDIIATVSVLGSAGIKGSEAATTMKNIFSRLASPTSEVQKGFEMIGLNQKNFITQSGKLKDTQGIFKALAETTKDMTDVQTLEVFKNIFGMRGMAGAAVLQKNIKQIREQLIRMGKDPQKVMEETAAFMRNSMGNRIKVLISALTELAFSFIEAFAGPGSDGMKSLSDLLLKMVPTVKLFGKLIAASIPYLKYALMLYVGWKVALMGLMLIQKSIIAVGWIKYLWMMRDVIIKATLATKAWSIAIGILTSPITLTVAAIAALGYAIYDMYTNWDKYVLGFKIGLNEWIIKWRELKLIVTGVMHDLGMASDKSLVVAANEYKLTKFETDLMKERMDKLYNSAFKPSSNFASPVSRQIVSETTTTNNGNVNINVKGSKEYVDVKKEGKMPVGAKLNLGLQ